MNTTGFQDMYEFTNKFLNAVRPRYVTMVGICGGKKENLDKVIWFTSAKYYNDNSGKAESKYIEIVHQNYIPKELWKNSPPIREISLQPKENECIFTIPTKVPTENVEELMKQHQTEGVDMEIAAMWVAVSLYNQDHPSNQTIPLTALKAVSDTGSKVERDIHRIPAMEHVSRCLLAYFRSLSHSYVTFEEQDAILYSSQSSDINK